MVNLNNSFLINEKNILFAEKDSKLKLVKITFVGNVERDFPEREFPNLWNALAVSKNEVKILPEKR